MHLFFSAAQKTGMGCTGSRASGAAFAPSPLGDGHSRSVL
jgi:hypothetical protein